jgi:hypothetical protein
MNDNDNKKLKKKENKEEIRVTCRRGVERDFGRGKWRSE